MSTKCTIDCNDDYHLYQECFENDNVWLQLDDISAMSIRIEKMPESRKSTNITIGIPVETWRHIIEAWLRSSWGKDKTMDHSSPAADLDGFDDFLKTLSKNNTNDE